MARGGKRPGAGRPRGSRDGSPVKREIRKAVTEKIVEEVRAEGILPLDVMTALMREYWEAGGTESKEKAAYWADRCAPYFHPKLANVQHTGDPDNPVHQQTRVEMILIDAGHEYVNTDDPLPRSEETRTAH